MSDYLKCEICLEQIAEPHALPCGHSFCGPPKDCLNGLQKGDTLQCYVCRTKHKLQLKDLQPLYGIREYLREKKLALDRPTYPASIASKSFKDIGTNLETLAKKIEYWEREVKEAEDKSQKRIERIEKELSVEKKNLENMRDEKHKLITQRIEFDDVKKQFEDGSLRVSDWSKVEKVGNTLDELMSPVISDTNGLHVEEIVLKADFFTSQILRWSQGCCSPPIRFNNFFIWLNAETKYDNKYVGVFLNCAPIAPSHFPTECTLGVKFQVKLKMEEEKMFEKEFSGKTFRFESKDRSGGYESLVYDALIGYKSANWGFPDMIAMEIIPLGVKIEATARVNFIK